MLTVNVEVSEEMIKRMGYEVIREYLQRQIELLGAVITEEKETKEISKLSEPSFKEWDNEEDNVYDRL